METTDVARKSVPETIETHDHGRKIDVWLIFCLQQF